jgi:hypothetical protein
MQWTRLAGFGLLFVVAVGLAADPKPDVAGDKQSLAALQAYVGPWKGVGQPRRGSTQGAWTEQADWAWQFSGGRAALVFQSPQGKYFHSGALRPGEQPDTYRLTVTLPDGKTQEHFDGSLEDGRLVLRAEKPAEGRPAQISIRQVAGGDRMLILLERSLPGSESFTRLAEIGYTRQGSGFGKGNNQPECVVTGGYGSITVTHAGQTYYVCCTGCRDLFNEDPEATLAEYRARKQKEREEQGK